MNFEETAEFKKDFKKLGKKYKSLSDDLTEFKKIVSLYPLGNSRHFNVLTKNDKCSVVKARLFCKYLKGSSLRIIYAHIKDNESVEFIELYFKGSSETENSQRIKTYLNSLE